MPSQLSCLKLSKFCTRWPWFPVLHPHEFYWFICRYPYLAVVLNFSQTWALYCLIQFYTATKEKLEPIKPLSKFLTFKSIVFLTWWQGVAVAFLFSTGIFKGHLAQRLQTRIQDYIICLEVCFICHFCCPLSWFWLCPFLVGSLIHTMQKICISFSCHTFHSLFSKEVISIY